MAGPHNRRFGSRASLFAAFALLAILPIGTAWPQSAPAPAPAAPPSPSPPAAAHEENPGLVNEIGKLLKYPSTLLPSFGTPRETNEGPTPDPKLPAETRPAVETGPPAETKPPAESTPPAPSKQPADAKPERPSLLRVPSMVSGRTVCPVSSTGGPDCKAAADALCKSKGFTEGSSLGTDSAEKCSAKLLIPGRARQPGDCRTESFVTRAWCQ